MDATAHLKDIITAVLQSEDVYVPTSFLSPAF